MPAPRLFVSAPLAEGAPAPLSEGQARYLTQVMRLAPGAEALAFNGADGEWRCRLTLVGKRQAALVPETQVRPQLDAPDLTLLFAPLKRQTTDWLVEKATELGARRLQPVLTRRTAAETVRTDRLALIAIEAAEQCGRLDAPEVAAPAPLAQALAGWPADRPILFADEAAADTAPHLLAGLTALHPPPAALALLIGPEGGFDAAERQALRARAEVAAVSLGPRILRAETAAMAGLALIGAVWPPPR